MGTAKRFFLLLIITLSPVTFANNAVDSIAADYIKLVLAVGEHDPVYVDAYYGPKAYQEQVKQAKWSLDEIIKQGNGLQQQLASMKAADNLDNKLRRHYLAKQLTALVFHAQQLDKKVKGIEEKRSFNREAQALYDTTPPSYDFTHFDKVLAELDATVPGEGDLGERMAAFDQLVTIPKDKIDTVFKAAMNECRARTEQNTQLPKNESFVIEYVNDKAWSGYNWYQGGANSLIQVNTDFPILISRAVDLGCHEGYPGHHTYNALLEEHLVNQKDWPEMSVYPLFSPQSLIAEGSANYGIQMAFPGEQKLAFEKEKLYPLAGIDVKHAETFEKILTLKSQLEYARNEIARQYIEGDIDRDTAIKLQAKYALEGMEKAEQRIRFVEKYGAYVINYNWGKKLVKDYIESNANTAEERWALFEQLLSSPRLPSSIDWR